MSMVILLTPAIVFAVEPNPDVAGTCSSMRNLTGFFDCFQGLAMNVIGLLVFMAILFFFWNLAMYLKDYDSEEKRKDSREYMIYSVIAIFVMVSVMSIVGILSNTFGFGSGRPQYNSDPRASCAQGNTSPWCQTTQY